MAEGGGFKHIKVTPAEEDDVVIYAGAGRATGTGPSRAPDAAPSPRGDDGPGRERSLDDLDAGPMPMRQKLVIIAAIVLIIVAAVYYFAVIR